ncbi:MAG TPA: glucosamine-6-phosphate deaminase [Terriglobia bacterium]|nr:glucosamine-6-phosphate deaminase [Terriglobia bacterium]
MAPPLRSFVVDRASVSIYASKEDAGAAAAVEAASALRHALSTKERARIIVATGNSQEDFIRALISSPDIDWSRIEVFHMDEYVGISDSHPASFRRWVRTRLVEIVHPGQVHYLNGDASDLTGECKRYARLLKSAPIDLCCLGFGENRHIAFNDPHAANFSDPIAVKEVTLDEACRRQQVGEGHFPGLDAVPREALTLTCPALLSAQRLVCCVPERRKAAAVKDALTGPITTACPASIVRTHPGAAIFLDLESASYLSQ